MIHRKPVPVPNGDTKVFWDGCNKKELRFQKCRRCEHIRWPASIICPKCYSYETEIVVSKGKGKIFTFAIYHQAYHRAFVGDLPYVVAIVELVEGPRMLSNIVGSSPEKIRCDIPVKVTWENMEEKIALPKFEVIDY